MNWLEKLRMRLKGVSMMKSRMMTKMLMDEKVVESHLPVRTMGIARTPARMASERWSSMTFQRRA